MVLGNAIDEQAEAEANMEKLAFWAGAGEGQRKVKPEICIGQPR